jgi:hypothetical protein
VALKYDQEISLQLNFASVVKPNTVKMLMALLSCLEVLRTFDFLVQMRTTKSPLPIDAIEPLAAPHTMTLKEQSEVDSYPYIQIISALLYVALCIQNWRYHTQLELYRDTTRPELMHHAS